MMSSNSSVAARPVAVVALGNPLLDMTVFVSDDKLATKYKLPVDGQTEVNLEQQNIFQEVLENYPVKLMAGGSAQNTLRIFQWLVGDSWTSVFMGGIGNDKVGSILKDIVQKDGVQVRYAYHEELPTGSCVALVNGENRSLAANIGAANVFNEDQLNQQDCPALLQQTRLLYIEGFFLTHSVGSALKATLCVYQRGGKCALNLSGCYVCDQFHESVSSLLPFQGIVFGNDKEFRTLATKLKLCTEDKMSDIETVAKAVAGYDRNNSQNQNEAEESQDLNKIPPLQLKSRLVVVTQGYEPVICATRSQSLRFPIERIAENELVDTTGAGDAFVAGFLAQLILGKSVEDCVTCGDITAKAIIAQVGCKIPDHPPTHMNVSEK